MSSINLRRFDPKSVNPHCVALFLGRRGEGKSQLMLDLMFHNKHKYPIGFVFSQTDAHTSKPLFRKHMPPQLCFESWNGDTVDKMISSAKKLKKSHFILLDDQLSLADTWIKSRQAKELFFNGRHYNIGFYVTLQSVLGVPPSYRAQADYVFLFRCPIKNERKKMYEHYAGMFPDYDTFEKVFETCTTNYGCLVIDNTTKSNNLEDIVFFYKASIDHRGRLCSPSLWEAHERQRAQNPETNVREQRHQTRRGNVTIRLHDNV